MVGAHVPVVYVSPGFEARQELDVHEPPGLRLVAGRSQAKSVSGPAVRGLVRTLYFGR